MTSSLDFYLSVAQVQLLQQLIRDNVSGIDAPEETTEVHSAVNRYESKRIHTHSLFIFTQHFYRAMPILLKNPSWLLSLRSAPNYRPLTILGDSNTFKYLLTQSEEFSNVALV